MPIGSKGGQKSSFLTPQIGPKHICASGALNLPKIHIFPMDFTNFINPFGATLSLFRRHFGVTLRILKSIWAYDGDRRLWGSSNWQKYTFLRILWKRSLNVYHMCMHWMYVTYLSHLFETYARGISVVYEVYCQQLKKAAHVICYRLKCYMPYAVCYMLSVTCYMLCLICYMLDVIWYRVYVVW